MAPLALPLATPLTRGKNRWRIDWRGYFGMLIYEKNRKIEFLRKLTCRTFGIFFRGYFFEEKSFFDADFFA